MSSQKELELKTHLHGFDADQFVTSLFEPLDDFADEATVDAIRLDHDEGAFSGLSHVF
jgi:hypothetical protein